MITFDDKHSISDISISTALGFGGGIFPYTMDPAYIEFMTAVHNLGVTVFPKSTTRYKRKGNFIPWNPLTWKYIQRIDDLAMLNAYGLTNKGVQAYTGLWLRLLKNGSNIIPSFYPEFSKGTHTAVTETVESVKIMRNDLGDLFWGVQVNFSCANSSEAIDRNMQDAARLVSSLRVFFPNLVIIAKIGVVHPIDFVVELERLGVRAVQSFNAVPYGVIFPDRKSPLSDVGGGSVSGSEIFSLCYGKNKALRKAVKLPLIMGGGATSLDRIMSYRDIGADCVDMCTFPLRKPAEAENAMAVTIMCTERDD